MKSQVYWHNPETGSVLSDDTARSDGIDTSTWTKVALHPVAAANCTPEPWRGEAEAIVDAAQRLARRGFFAPSTCADSETAADMALMRCALAQIAWPRITRPGDITSLTDDLIAILGRPNFTCIRLAQALRLCGTEIKTKAEHEQAAVIHFLLMRYVSHGSDWAKQADADLREMLDQVDAKNKAAVQSAEAKGGCHGK